MFNFHSFFIYSFITTFTPGPNNITSMSYAARLGLRNSYRFNLGIFIGFFIVMFSCSVFSSTLLNYIPKVRIYMVSIGSAYMLYLAWKILKSSFEVEIEKNGKASFSSGVLLQFINPKLYVYAITVMTLYVLPVFDSYWILAGFSFFLALMAISSTFVWAFFGELFHKLPSKYTLAINSVMSLLLVYCAVSLFF